MRRFYHTVVSLTFFSILATATSAQEKVVLEAASRAEWQKAIDTYGLTHRIVKWDIRVIKKRPRYFLSMKKGKVRAHQIRTDRTAEAFAELKRIYKEQRFVFKKQVQYKVKGKTLYGGYWQK